MDYTITKRHAIKFSIEKNFATITILKPNGGEHAYNGFFFVLYENTIGDFYLRKLNKEGIASEYGIDHRDLENLF